MQSYTSINYSKYVSGNLKLSLVSEDLYPRFKPSEISLS